MPTFPVIRVECYAGYKGEERPTSFELKGRKIEVDKIVDQWAGPDYRYFKVIGNDRRTYILKYGVEKDEWECEFTE